VTIVSGALPDGLSVNTSGLVTGTRTALGSYTWTVRVTGDDGETADLDDSCDTIDDINSAIFSDSPILHWPLDETSGTTARDLSGNNYDGTYSGGTLTGSGFKMASYYTDNVVASTGSLSGSPLDVGTQRQWAIEAVVTRDATQPFDNINANIAAQWRSANFGYASIKLGMPSTGKIATSWSAYFTDQSLASAIGVSSSAPPVIGERTHILAERVQGPGSTDTMNIYLNGVLSGTTAVSSSEVGTPSNGQQFTVGGNAFGYGWNGTVEHVAAYGHSLGAARALYHAQLLGLAT
jgi:hypothetical protein